MPKYNEKKIPYTTQDRLMDLFCQTILKLNNKGEIKNFLKDLLNRQERMMLIRRLLIADMLSKSKTYQEIVDKLHCGPATIAKVEKLFSIGRNGYKVAIKK